MPLSFPTEIFTFCRRVPDRDEYVAYRFRYLSKATYEFFYPDGSTKAVRRDDCVVFTPNVEFGRVSGLDVYNRTPPSWFDAGFVDAAIASVEQELGSLEGIRKRL